MCQLVVLLTLGLIYHWSPSAMAAADQPNLLANKHFPGAIPVLVKGDGTNGSGRQLIYVQPRAYLLCWNRVCDPRLLAEMVKRTPYYNFGLGKRSVESEEMADELSEQLENDKRGGGGAAARYNFGIGKKDEQNHRFNFGIGKREGQHRFAFGLGKRDPLKHKFAFGLGKRDAEATAEDVVENSLEEMDQQQKRQLYNFGLGKRASGPYNFGLGKRDMRYAFGLGKRIYNFGLGKKSQNDFENQFHPGDDDADPVEQTDENHMEEEIEENETKRAAGPYSFGLGKRSADYKRHRFAFGLGKREATTTSPLSEEGPSLEEKNSSRTTAIPTKESHH